MSYAQQSTHTCEICLQPVESPVVVTGESLCKCDSCLEVQRDEIQLKDGAPAPLVYKFISQERLSLCRDIKKRISSKSQFCSTREAVGLAVYQKSVKIIRNFKPSKNNATPSKRSEIQSFSNQSKARLKFKASNAFPELISQFCLTFQNNKKDNNVPQDGKETKKLLNAFLTTLRDNYPDTSYLWILEFQGSGVPHYHLFLSLDRNTEGLHEFMATAWTRITRGSKAHYRFHMDPVNFIRWEMHTGAYLTKYLDKDRQKAVPDGFLNVGRFWGCTRGLVPPPEIITEQEFKALDHTVSDNLEKTNVDINAIKFITRTLCRLHEKRLQKYGFKSRSRKTPMSFMIHNVADQFWSMFRLFTQQAHGLRYAEAPF